MVCAIIVYLHGGKQRPWRGKGASGPAWWRQAGVGAPFLLGRLAGERVCPQAEVARTLVIRHAMKAQ
jgi:hypothetical protein